MSRPASLPAEMPIETLTEGSPELYDGASTAPRESGALLPRIGIDVFTRTGELRESLRRVSADRRAARTAFTFHDGSFAEAAAHYRDALSPDLVIIEQCGWTEDLDWLIEGLAEVCQSTTRVLVIGDRNDVVLYRHLMRSGVSDYLFMPVEPLVVIEAVRAIFQSGDDAAELGTVIAFTGARGGSGASMLAQNTAALLSRDLSATTLLIDADLGFGTAAMQFDISPPCGLGEALTEGDDLDKEVLERLVHWHGKGLGILTAPERAEQIGAPPPQSMREVVDQARRIARYVVLDLPHGWSPWVVEALAAADSVVLVATPDLPSLRNARTLIGLVTALRPNDGPPSLVLNRVAPGDKPPVAPEEFARILNCKIAATIPFEPAAAPAEMAGTILAEMAPKSEAARAMRAFAAAISGRERPNAPPARTGSLLSRLFRRRPA